MFYVYTRCKHGIPAKQIFDELIPPITPFLDGLEKFRRVVSSFRKVSPQGDPFPPLMLQISRKLKVLLMKTDYCRAMSLNLSQEPRKQLSMASWLVIWGSEMSIPSGSHTNGQCSTSHSSPDTAVFGR